MLGKVRELVLPAIERHGPIEAWIIDDTGFPKKGRHSVGVARQYCGQVGKQDNCQVAVSLSLANRHASLPVAWRLYLPKEWAADEERRRKAGVPEEVDFATKPQIALEQLREACAAGLPRGDVLMDPGYGHDGQLRAAVTALGLAYVAGIQSNSTVWPSGSEPRHGDRAPTTGRRDEPDLVWVKEVALGLPNKAWRRIKWREGSADWLSSRFARLRVRVGHRHRRPDNCPQEWLLIEWPKGEKEPTKYWLSTLPERISFRAGRSRQAALAHRARLSGTQAGARLAWLPSSRHAVHRRLRLPDLRAADDSPLGNSSRRAVRATCPSPRLPTPRIRPCGLSVTSQTRSPRCADD